MLQDTSSEKSTFICADVLDECAVESRVKISSSLTESSKSRQALGYPRLEDYTFKVKSRGVFLQE